MRRSASVVLAATVLAAVASSSTGSSAAARRTPKRTRTTKVPATTVPATKVPATTAPKVVPEGGSFALRAYRGTVAAGGASANVIVSPYSIAEALSLVRGGAKGATASQIDAALGQPNDPSQRASLRSKLVSDTSKELGTYARIGNSLWVQNRYPLAPAFSSLARDSYGAHAEAVDFTNDSVGSAKQINDWVSRVTERQIAGIITPDDLDTARLVLANAVLFHGRWQHPFDPANTVAEPFRTAAGSSNVSTMTGAADVTPGPMITTVQLSYTGPYRMRIAVPADGVSLDAAMSQLLGSDATATPPCPNVAAHVPRWRSSSTIDLIPTLRGMGVTDLFEPTRADLSGISPAARTEGLYVSTARHKATIGVDEEGTIAAAVTALVASPTSAAVSFGTCPSDVRLNRPFVYVIQHAGTGEVLFEGQVTNPA